MVEALWMCDLARYWCGVLISTVGVRATLLLCSEMLQVRV
jgi:hypothetical protein